MLCWYLHEPCVNIVIYCGFMRSRFDLIYKRDNLLNIFVGVIFWIYRYTKFHKNQWFVKSCCWDLCLIRCKTSWKTAGSLCNICFGTQLRGGSTVAHPTSHPPSCYIHHLCWIRRNYGMLCETQYQSYITTTLTFCSIYSEACLFRVVFLANIL